MRLVDVAEEVVMHWKVELPVPPHWTAMVTPWKKRVASSLTPILACLSRQRVRWPCRVEMHLLIEIVA
jgi:hypothetical protein